MTIRIVRYWILAADFVCLLGALAFAIGLHYPGTRAAIDLPAVLRAYALLIPPALVTWTLLYFEMRLDGFEGGWQLPAILSKIVVAVSVVLLVLLAVALLTKGFYWRKGLVDFSLFFAPRLNCLSCIVRFW